MADLTLNSDTNTIAEDTPMADSTTYPGAPRWVKVFGIIGLAVVLLVATMMLTGGKSGDHGPGRHIPSVDAGGQTAPSSVTQSGDSEGHTPPVHLP